MFVNRGALNGIKIRRYYEAAIYYHQVVFFIYQVGGINNFLKINIIDG
jgi:hypothetical protein